jgi:hypothetical protein
LKLRSFVRTFCAFGAKKFERGFSKFFRKLPKLQHFSLHVIKNQQMDFVGAIEIASADKHLTRLVSCIKELPHDVLFSVQGELFRVHRAILAASSDYFKVCSFVFIKTRRFQLFHSQEMLAEADGFTIMLFNVDKNHMKLLLDMMYLQSVKISQKDIVGVNHLAQKFAINVGFIPMSYVRAINALPEIRLSASPATDREALSKVEPKIEQNV